MNTAARNSGKDVLIGAGTAWRRVAGAIVAAIAAVALTACGDSGADVEENPITSLSNDVSDYTGPPPATDDVQAFKINVWDNVHVDNRCGGCHVQGGQSPSFARDDDVNLAYAEANGIVDLGQPSESRMVTKVAGGHNCWLESDTACADILTTWVSGWAGEAAAGEGRQIELSAPVIMDVGSAKSFPTDSGLFGATVHPVLTTYCVNCHTSGALTPQSPYFAEADVDVAYDAVKSKINLDAPADSRLVLRLRNEFHNCWSNCSSDSADMEAAIDAFASQIALTPVDPTLLTSKALGLFDGIIASGGNRAESNVIALYEFKAGGGGTAFDTSGVEPALDLTLSGDVSWFGGWGIDIKGGKAQASTTSSRKLHDLIKATGEYAIEAWAVPGNVTQEEARIVSYSAGTLARNFNLGQTLYNYDFFNRSSVTDGNGVPSLSTADADEDLQATLQHVVLNFDPVNGRSIYVNGVHTDDLDAEGGGSIADWDDTFAFVLGNEVSGDRPWIGVLRLVAIHNRVLTPEQITQNFDAGVGEKFFLLFSVSDFVNVPDAYIMFEVSQFDSYSYLFDAPAFISLDAAAQPDNIPLSGMRIGMNGAELPVGQAYRTLETSIDAANYTELGQPLSDIGTIVALDKGPEADVFFLTFDIIGANANVRTEPVPLQPPPPADGEAVAELGTRTFDEINATMSVMTGISTQEPEVKTTYELVKQQLPTVENIEVFASAHQVGVAQLAIEYCNALVEDGAMAASFFPGFNFAASAEQAFDTQAERDMVFDPLLDNFVGTGLGSQPDPADVKAELGNLTDILTNCSGACDGARTGTTVKAVCAAVIASAAMLVQ